MRVDCTCSCTFFFCCWDWFSCWQVARYHAGMRGNIDKQLYRVLDTRRQTLASDWICDRVCHFWGVIVIPIRAVLMGRHRINYAHDLVDHQGLDPFSMKWLTQVLVARYNAREGCFWVSGFLRDCELRRAEWSFFHRIREMQVFTWRSHYQLLLRGWAEFFQSIFKGALFVNRQEFYQVINIWLLLEQLHADMTMVTETATRKRVFSIQSERNPSWASTPFAPCTPFGLANGFEITPPFEKRLRTVKKPISTFKWKPDLPGNLHFSVGYDFSNVEVKTPTPAAWQNRPSRGLSTPPNVRYSREKYENVKQEMKQRPNSWFSKLDYSTSLAEDALDRVGRPATGLNFTIGPTRSYYFKYVDAKRELEDYKRVVQAVNSHVPLTSNGTHTVFPSLESMRRGASNLQQGPRNLYNIQEGIAKESQMGAGNSNNRIQNGDSFTRTVHEEAQPHKDAGPESSVQPRAASLSRDDDEAHVPEDDDQKEIWRTLLEKAQDPAEKARMESQEKEIEALQEQWSRLQLHREEDELRRQKEREASKKEVVRRLHFWCSCILKCYLWCL